MVEPGATGVDWPGVPSPADAAAPRPSPGLRRPPARRPRRWWNARPGSAHGALRRRGTPVHCRVTGSPPPAGRRGTAESGSRLHLELARVRSARRGSTAGLVQGARVAEGRVLAMARETRGSPGLIAGKPGTPRPVLAPTGLRGSLLDDLVAAGRRRDPCHSRPGGGPAPRRRGRAPASRRLARLRYRQFAGRVAGGHQRSACRRPRTRMTCPEHAMLYLFAIMVRRARRPGPGHSPAAAARGRPYEFFCIPRITLAVTMSGKLMDVRR